VVYCQAGHQAHRDRSGIRRMTSLDDLDLSALQTFFVESGIAVNGALHAAKINGGRSNLTYRINDARQTWVLRRPPGAGLTPSAHDVGREFRVMAALQTSAIPVPTTLINCIDLSVIGAPFTLVSFVPGAALRTQADLLPLEDERLAAVHAELIRVLAALHSTPFESVGLDRFGRPEGFVTRQIQRWRQQWDLVATRELEDVARLYKALDESPPRQQGSSIVHGDFRVDNTLLDLERPRLRALVDWEMSTLGDPLTDLATMCAYQDPDFDYLVGEAAASTSSRWPVVEVTAETYARLTGADLSDFDRYLALALFKVAVIAEGIAARYRSGVGSGPGFDTAHQAVPGLIARGLSLMKARR
jgi:aminoglycoside phosphotransferase (APT) family kinase protein